MAREQVVIRVDGENGVHGSKHETWKSSNTTSERGELRAHELPGTVAGSGARTSRLQGNDGRHGRNATSPSAGTAARKVCVELSSSLVKRIISSSFSYSDFNSKLALEKAY